MSSIPGTRPPTKSSRTRPWQPGEWHHVMVTFDGSISGHQASAIYIDGKKVASKTYPNTVGGNIETAVPLRLGSRHGGESKLNGQVALQDFRFYRRLLSESEIGTLAKNSELQHIVSLPPEQADQGADRIAVRLLHRQYRRPVPRAATRARRHEDRAGIPPGARLGHPGDGGEERASPSPTSSPAASTPTRARRSRPPRPPCCRRCRRTRRRTASASPAGSLIPRTRCPPASP